MYLDRVEAALPLRVAFQKGSRVPAHCSASGKLFLAMMPPAKRKRVVDALVLDRHTQNTLTDLEALNTEPSRIKGLSYALDDEEFLSGLFCIAVRIRDSRVSPPARWPPSPRDISMHDAARCRP